MTKLTNGAEGGTNGTTVTTGNSGGSSGSAFDAVTIGASAGLIFDNTHSAHGTLSYKFTTPATDTNSLLKWSTSLTGSTLTSVWIRGYVYITAHTGTLKMMEVVSGSTVVAVIALNSSGKVLIIDETSSTLATSTTTVPLNQWFRLEAKVLAGTGSGTIECKIFTTSPDEVTPDETISSAAAYTSSSFNGAWYGNPTSVASYTFWMDDLGVSTTGYLGPVNDISGTINLKKPVLSGTGHLQPVITGTIKLKKPVLSGTSAETTYISGTIKLKKPSLSGTGFNFGTTIGISWDSLPRNYFTGVSNAVLYVKDHPGVPWNGLISVTEKGDPKPSAFYVDGQLYRNRSVPDAFNGTISAYTYPDQLEPYIGIIKGIAGQPRDSFDLTYRNNNEIHLVYNVLLGPSNDVYASIGANTSPLAFSWAFTTLPAKIPGGRSAAHLVIDIPTAHPSAVSDLENIIYGDDANSPSMPSVDTVLSLFETYAEMVITDNGDGSWTATGPDSAISAAGDYFTITWPSARFLDADSYSIRTL